ALWLEPCLSLGLAGLVFYPLGRRIDGGRFLRLRCGLFDRGRGTRTGGHYRGWLGAIAAGQRRNRDEDHEAGCGDDHSLLAVPRPFVAGVLRGRRRGHGGAAWIRWCGILVCSDMFGPLISVPVSLGAVTLGVPTRWGTEVSGHACLLWSLPVVYAAMCVSLCRCQPLLIM